MRAVAIGLALLVGSALCPGAGAAAAQPEGRAVMDNTVFAHVLFDQLEGRTDAAGSRLRWDGEGWIGTDMNRLWLKSEATVESGRVHDGSLEVLYDRPLPRLRYFDWQAGLREDLDSGPRRTWVAFGIEGLAPFFFEVAPTAYVGTDGRVAGRLTAFYDLLVTQRLVAQPELELNAYSSADPARGIGEGISTLDAGIRVRYEVSRKFAPYVGIAWARQFGETAAFARQAGDQPSATTFVFGLRAWY